MSKMPSELETVQSRLESFRKPALSMWGMQSSVHAGTQQQGYSEETRLLAIRMYVEGNSYGSIARILKVNPQSVANWVQSYSAKLPPAPVPTKVKKAELDELYTFVGKKKTKSTS